ncbi:MAG: MMPL family transporter, partial [Candidatus Xenobia bacterium]
MVVLWLVILAISLPGSERAHTLLHGGGGYIPGSPSRQVDLYLSRHFDSAFEYPVLIVYRDHQHTVHDRAFSEGVGRVQDALDKTSFVRATRSYREIPNWQMTSPDGHTTVILAGVRASSMEDVETRVPELRQTLSALKPPDGELLVAGDAAFNYDVDALSAVDARVAEKRALPFVLLCLLAAFGALVSAGLPLALGVLSTTVTGAIVYALAHILPLSIL